MSHLEERRLSRRDVYDGKVLHLVVDTVSLPNGKEATREVCLHIGAVAILPLLDDGSVLVEKQYRYPHARVFTEIPAGKLDFPGEDPLDAAKRELREETGALAARWTPLGGLDTSPAVLSEKIEMFLAEGLTFGPRDPDEDEFLDVEAIPLTELVDLVLAGKIRDAKTQAAVMKVFLMKKNEGKSL